MTCPRSPDGVHRFGFEADRCTSCKRPMPVLRLREDQPWRTPIRPMAGAGAYGKTAETRAIDVAKRRAGDDE